MNEILKDYDPMRLSDVHFYNENLTDVELPLFINGSLFLFNCILKNTVFPKYVRCALEITNCDCSNIELTEYVGEHVSIFKCNLENAILPLCIGGMFEINYSTNIPNGVYNIGSIDNDVITVYNHTKKGLVVYMDYIIKTESEWYETINKKYGNVQKYEKKVAEAFQLYHKNNKI